MWHPSLTAVAFPCRFAKNAGRHADWEYFFAFVAFPEGILLAFLTVLVRPYHNRVTYIATPDQRFTHLANAAFSHQTFMTLNVACAAFY